MDFSICHISRRAVSSMHAKPLSLTLIICNGRPVSALHVLLWPVLFKHIIITHHLATPIVDSTNLVTSCHLQLAYCLSSQSLSRTVWSRQSVLAVSWALVFPFKTQILATCPPISVCQRYGDGWWYILSYIYACKHMHSYITMCVYICLFMWCKVNMWCKEMLFALHIFHIVGARFVLCPIRSTCIFFAPLSITADYMFLFGMPGLFVEPHSSSIVYKVITCPLPSPSLTHRSSLHWWMSHQNESNCNLATLNYPDVCAPQRQRMSNFTMFPPIHSWQLKLLT